MRTRRWISAPAERTTAGPMSKGRVQAACTDTHLQLHPQRRRRLLRHGRLRLPRHAVPRGNAGELLLRRLLRALDQADDVRREWQCQRRLQVRAARPGTNSAGDIVYLTEGPDGALYYLDLGYADTTGTFGISKLRRHPLSAIQPGPGGARLGGQDIGSRAACRELLERRLERSGGTADHVLVGLRGRHASRPPRIPSHTFASPGQYVGSAHGLGRREQLASRRR